MSHVQSEAEIARQIVMAQKRLNEDFITTKIREGYHMSQFEEVPAAESISWSPLSATRPAGDPISLRISPTVRLKRGANPVGRAIDSEGGKSGAV